MPSLGRVKDVRLWHRSASDLSSCLRPPFILIYAAGSLRCIPALMVMSMVRVRKIRGCSCRCILTAVHSSHLETCQWLKRVVGACCVCQVFLESLNVPIKFLRCFTLKVFHLPLVIVVFTLQCLFFIWLIILPN